MKRSLIVTRSAEADLLDSYLDYELKQAGLGTRFLDEVEMAFDRILHNPLLYQEVPGISERAALTRACQGQRKTAVSMQEKNSWSQST